MKIIKWLSLILAVILLPSGALAASSLEGLSVQEYYDLALEAFKNGDYADAADLFGNAGNHLDARKWQFYALAIDEVIHNGSSASAMADAENRFELLAAQDFEQAAQWATYCDARSHELSGFKPDAAAKYETILIYDSIERYLACKGSAYDGLLESADQVRRRVGGVSGSAAALYNEAMDLYLFGIYDDAADYFCLAGNYSDARQWRCYCKAIDLVVSDDDLDRANVLFTLLSAHDFADSADWVIYCKGRYAEAGGFTADAIKEYKKIFLHDSSERYMTLLQKLYR